MLCYCLSLQSLPLRAHVTPQLLRQHPSQCRPFPEVIPDLGNGCVTYFQVIPNLGLIYVAKLSQIYPKSIPNLSRFFWETSYSLSQIWDRSGKGAFY
jgi:hypothetical protein